MCILYLLFNTILIFRGTGFCEFVERTAVSEERRYKMLCVKYGLKIFLYKL